MIKTKFLFYKTYYNLTDVFLTFYIMCILGPMLYKGVYHFFYQYNPDAATFGTIIWGHAVSHDLVNWIHLDPAIYPSHEPDINSCWSGSATILPGNIPAMLYTGSDSKSRQVQNLAWPKNLSDPFLREWVKSTKNPIITPPDGVKDDCFRDPSTAWRGTDNVWRIIVGGDRDNNGMAFLYQSTDFVTWTPYRQPLAASADATGTWECPDFFPVPLNSTNGLDTSVNSGGVVHVMKAGFEGHDWYTIGTYSSERENFLPQNGLKLSGSSLDLRYDYGNFYASKSFYDDLKNRRVLWAWVPESDSEDDDIKKGWAGLQVILNIRLVITQTFVILDSDSDTDIFAHHVVKRRRLVVIVFLFFFFCFSHFLGPFGLTEVGSS